jgi:YVTN family beta-propeller protein
VIGGSSYTKIGKAIPVGGHPSAIGVDPLKHTIYVTNQHDNTVSVINGSSNTKIGKAIPVGKEPSAIGVNQFTDAIYVANQHDTEIK